MPTWFMIEFRGMQELPQNISTESSISKFYDHVAIERIHRISAVSEVPLFEKCDGGVAHASEFIPV